MKNTPQVSRPSDFTAQVEAASPAPTAERGACGTQPLGDGAHNEPHRFRGYRLDPVYLRSSPEQRAEAVAFWLAQRVLRAPGAADRRAAELVYLVRRADGTLVGMSTVAVRTAGDGRRRYVFRMFLRREDRVPYLMRAVTNATRDLLRDFTHPQGPMAGMLIETENRKLMRPGIRRYLERHGYLYRGRSRRGVDLWLAPFEGPDRRAG